MGGQINLYASIIGGSVIGMVISALIIKWICIDPVLQEVLAAGNLLDRVR